MMRLYNIFPVEICYGPCDFQDPNIDSLYPPVITIRFDDLSIN